MIQARCNAVKTLYKNRKWIISEHNVQHLQKSKFDLYEYKNCEKFSEATEKRLAMFNWKQVPVLMLLLGCNPSERVVWHK